MTTSGDFAGLLRQHLGMLLGGSESPQAFWHWFINRWWFVESSVDDESWRLGNSIEHLFYIYNDGLFTDEQLREQVREAIEDRAGATTPQEYTVEVIGDPPPGVTRHPSRPRQFVPHREREPAR